MYRTDWNKYPTVFVFGAAFYSLLIIVDFLSAFLRSRGEPLSATLQKQDDSERRVWGPNVTTFLLAPLSPGATLAGMYMVVASLLCYSMGDATARAQRKFDSETDDPRSVVLAVYGTTIVIGELVNTQPAQMGGLAFKTLSGERKERWTRRTLGPIIAATSPASDFTRDRAAEWSGL